MNESRNLVGLKAISNFVGELAALYGDKFHELRLYKRLLKKTSVQHEKAISKHVEIFTDFCTKNREAITANDASRFVDAHLEYSEHVFLNLDMIFDTAREMDGNEVLPTMWKHLLNISQILDPTTSHPILESMKNSTNITTPPSNPKQADQMNLISNIITNIESKVKETQSTKAEVNQSEIVSEILQSGPVKELMDNMMSGNIDLNSLFQTFGSMCSQIKPPA